MVTPVPNSKVSKKHVSSGFVKGESVGVEVAVTNEIMTKALEVALTVMTLSLSTRIKLVLAHAGFDEERKDLKTDRERHCSSTTLRPRLKNSNVSMTIKMKPLQLRPTSPNDPTMSATVIIMTRINTLWKQLCTLL